LFERAELGENAIIVHINFLEAEQREELNECKELAVSAGANIVAIVTGSRAKPDPKYFVGLGKAEEIRDLIATTQASHAEDPALSSNPPANLVLFDHSLSPAQERNLEKLFKCRVLDRTGLILDIFAQRAQSFEGKLQVELAQLKHLSTRLIRGWTHLERQKGGIGLRGPGETQLESDRRLIRNRIKYIKKRLSKVQQQRDQSRRARQKALMPTVSLVGYTNAGKSTLFNELTGANIYVADQLFATLDPTLRQLQLSGAGKVILADTVGFIRHLPHDLVEAFSATLEETRDASILLHVIDIHDPERHAHSEQVRRVLDEIGADHVPILEVHNKIDLLNDNDAGIDRDHRGKPYRVRVSAANHIGIEALKTAIGELVYGDPVQRTVLLSPSEGRLRATLYDMDAVLSEKSDDEGNWLITVRIAKNDFLRLFPGETVEENVSNNSII